MPSGGSVCIGMAYDEVVEVDELISPSLVYGDMSHVEFPRSHESQNWGDSADSIDVEILSQEELSISSSESMRDSCSRQRDKLLW